MRALFLVAVLLGAGAATAAERARPASAAQQAQQDRMRSCNVDARGKTGEDRKAFMRTCLRRR